MREESDEEFYTLLQEACQDMRHRGVEFYPWRTWYRGHISQPESVNPLGAVCLYLKITPQDVRETWCIFAGWESAFLDGYMNRAPRHTYTERETKARAMGEFCMQEYLSCTPR